MLKSSFFFSYQSLHFVLWLESQMVLQVLKGMSEFWEPVSYESIIISGFPESGHCCEDT